MQADSEDWQERKDAMSGLCYQDIKGTGYTW